MTKWVYPRKTRLVSLKFEINDLKMKNANIKVLMRINYRNKQMEAFCDHELEDSILIFFFSAQDSVFLRH